MKRLPFILLLWLLIGPAYPQTIGIPVDNAGVSGKLGYLNGGTGVALPSHILGGTAAVVNLNSATTDTSITITSPTTNYRITSVYVMNIGTTASLTTATAGVFSSTGGAGISFAADQALSAITVKTANTAGNGTPLTMAAATPWINQATVQFRVGTAQGAAATANVYVYIEPLP